MVSWKTLLFATYWFMFSVQYASGTVPNMICSEAVPPMYTMHTHHDPYESDEYYPEEREMPPPPPPLPFLETKCRFVNLTMGPLPPVFESRDLFCHTKCERKLTVNDSSVAIILPSTFINYPSTNKLTLKSCGIENIQPGAFSILTSLRELYLTDNKITFIADGIFNSLVKLEILDLSNNYIQNISKHAFSGVFNLREFKISYNFLKQIDSSSLIHTGRLTELDASFNNISIFNFTDFEVENLKLSNNVIENVYGCFGQVTKLDLKNNYITSLENIQCKSNVSNIIELDISYNQLERVEKLPNLDNLKTLSLNNNKISFISNDFFLDLNQLQYLYLMANELDQFEYGLFDRLRNLEVLAVSNNHLTEFRKFTYHLLKKLRFLYIDYNEITSLDSKNLAKVLANLFVIDLNGNNFTCEELINIFHDLRGVTISPGHTYNSSNVHGIGCSKHESDISSIERIVNYNITSNDAQGNSLRIKLNKMFNADFTRSSMYNYFNRDFKKTNFYKYLENLKTIGNLSATSNYANENYLKNLRDFHERFNKSVIGYFNNDFRHSGFVKYFEKFRDSNDFQKNDVKENAMHNYFNKDFMNSNFYKYLESLKKPEFVIRYSSGAGTNITRVEKLVSTSAHREEERDENSALLIVITILLFAKFCMMLSFVYNRYSKRGKLYNIEKEQVELIDT